MEEGIQIVRSIVIFLARTFPMSLFIQRMLKSHWRKMGQKWLLMIHPQQGLSPHWHILHIIPMLTILKDMDPKGKIINVAFAISGAFVFGSHFGIVAGLNKEMAFAMIIGKLTGGLSAIILVLLAERNKQRSSSSVT